MEKFVFFDSTHAKLHSVSLQDSTRQQDGNEMSQHQNTGSLHTACGHCTPNVHLQHNTTALTVQAHIASVSLVHENKAPACVTGHLLENLNSKGNTNKRSLSFTEMRWQTKRSVLMESRRVGRKVRHSESPILKQV